MKTTVVLVLITLLSKQIFADYSVIPKGGVNLSTLSSSDIVLVGKDYTIDGINLYVGLEKIVNRNFVYGIDVMLLSAQEINYQEIIESTLATKTTSSTITSFNSGVSPMAKYFFNISTQSRIYTMAGMSLSFSYNNKYKETITTHNKIYHVPDFIVESDGTIPDDIANFHYGIMGGVGFSFSKIVVEGKYLYGLSDLHLFKDVASYHRIIAISAGYSFNFID